MLLVRLGAWVVLLLAVGGLALGAGENVSGFPSLKDIRGNGSLLLTTSIHNAQYDKVFPNMTFTCNGSITKWTFVAAEEEDKVSELKLLRKGSNSTYYPVAPALDVNIATHITGSKRASVYELSTPAGVPFQAGDILGIFQEESARYVFLYMYQRGKQFLSCNKPAQGSNNYSCGGSGDFGQPLLAIETEPPACSRGFLPSDTLIQIVASIGVTRGPDLALVFLHRKMTFNCVTNVTKFSVVAKVNKGDTRATKIKICKGGCYGSNNIHTISLNSFNVTSYLNIYECELDPPVMVSQGCFIVTEHLAGSSSSIYQSGPQLTGKPLISVEVNRESCGFTPITSGFIDQEELRKLATFIPSFAVGEASRLNGTHFPYMNITQDGQLIKWTFTAEDQGPEVGRTQYPVLWVMRNAEIAFSLNGSQAVLTDYPNVYEYIPDSPLSVEAGDYIAVLQPPEDTAHLLLSVVQCPVPGSELNVEKAVVPLVSLEVVGAPMITSVLPDMSTGSVSIALIPNVEVAGTDEEDSNSSSQVVLMIAGVAAVVAAVLVALAAAAAVIMAAQMRSKRTTNRSQETEQSGKEEQTNDYAVSGLHLEKDTKLKISTNEAYACHTHFDRTYAHPIHFREAHASPDHSDQTYARPIRFREARACSTFPNEAYAVHERAGVVAKKCVLVYDEPRFQ